MEPNKVKQIETAKLVREYGGDLTYRLNIDDAKCKLDYIFAQNKLIEITYTFTPISGDFRISSKDKDNIWDKTINNIIDKYGEPSIKEPYKLFVWNLEDFSIRATLENGVQVSYTPPTPSQKDIL